MKILLTGANGFIGRYLLTALVAAGHTVIPAVRRPAETDRMLGKPVSVRVDFNTATDPADWQPHLAGIDAVINCAGILQGRPGQSIDAIHARAPIALFEACRAAGIKRIIQISAISAEPDAGTGYAATKHAADSHLAAMADLDWVILRPSLVYAPGAYGGTALFRAIAALPFLTPVPGSGDQQFQPIHMDDLTAGVVAILADPGMRHITVDPVGPEPVPLYRLLADLRQWLDFAPVPAISIPMALVRLAARFGDVLGGPVNSTAIRQLTFGNTGSVVPFVAATGIAPRGWRTALRAHPAQTQDRWHARLYFVRPLLRAMLAVLWIASGLTGLIQPHGTVAAILGRFGLEGPAAQVAFWATSLGDIAIGIAVAARWRPKWTAAIQLAFVLGYTIGLTSIEPALWVDPFGPLLKNLPIVAAILALAAIEGDR
jgi:uncharacterized protein YbjT (DUF2867 family)/uncharacterized membrane protein YphA (DoxX/SURF4 family)